MKFEEGAFYEVKYKPFDNMQSTATMRGTLESIDFVRVDRTHINILHFRGENGATYMFREDRIIQATKELQHG